MSRIVKYHNGRPDNIFLTLDQSFAILRDRRLNLLDIRVLEKYVGADRMDQPLLVWRPDDQYFILLLEQIKLVCFPQYCMVFNHLNKVVTLYIIPF